MLKHSEMLVTLREQAKALVQARINVLQAEFNLSTQLESDFYPTLPIPQEAQEEHRRLIGQFFGIIDSLDKVESYDDLLKILEDRIGLESHTIYHFILDTLTTEYDIESTGDDDDAPAF